MELFKLVGTIIINNEQAKQELDETAKKAADTSNETQDAFNKIGTVAGGIVKGIATAGAAIGGAWLAAIEGSREYRAEMGKLDSAFQTSGHSSEVAKKTYSDLNAVLGDTGQAVEASQHLAVLAKNEKDLSTWTDICTGVYATFGASLPIESMTEAANETAKTGILTGGLVDALNWAGISEEKFQEKLDACNNEQERQKLIMDTLNGTYKGASDQYKKTNKDVMDAQKAQEKLTDAFAEVGRIGEPILTAIKDKVADMVSAAVPHLENFVNKVKDIITWVKENNDTVDKWVAVILGAGTAIGTFLLILSWGKIMTAAANAIKVVRTAILAMNAAMLANPIALVIAIIAGLVVAFVYLWNNVEGFRKFWIDAWKKIKSIASDAGKAISKFFSDSWKSITKTFSNVSGWFREKFQSAWSSIKNVFSSWGSFFGGLWTKIKSKFGSIGSSLGKSMGDSVKSAMNKVLSAIEKAINKGIGLINSAIKLANKLPGIKVGTVSKVNLPRLASGGVLEKGQVGLLEGNGAEAVVPLDRNRAWISAVAQDMKEVGIGGQSDAMVNYLKQLIDMLTDYFPQLLAAAGHDIVTNDGAIIARYAPMMNSELGKISARKDRGR